MAPSEADCPVSTPWLVRASVSAVCGSSGRVPVSGS